ncbi:hypothetical protein [Stenotrophomonas sp.]|uniref:hypothetical protein n=1 Tax=Stenotrophomonas sp. TaxID=69392 RepID=UPI00289CF96C|nr:hypothetical protein [Stenotrophomonas sp.]
MDVSGEVYIWVTAIEMLSGHTIMDGCNFDGQLGFGAEDVRQFKGPLAIVSPSKFEVVEAELGMMHLLHRGLFWTSDPEMPLAPPFMITSNLALTGPFHVHIDRALSIQASTLLNRHGYGSFPVCSPHAIGVLEYSATGSAILAFAQPGTTIDLDGWKFAEWDDELFVEHASKEAGG